MDLEERRWHHRPPHVFIPDTIYIITASTLHKKQHFYDDERLQLLQNTLFEVTAEYEWSLEAWAIFSNHYHFVARSPDNAATLKIMMQRLHSQTSRLLNRLDGPPGRTVWIQYWDTCLTFEPSYYARLNYVHSNAVKHGLVEKAIDYPFCSAAWFEDHADAALRRKVSSFPCDQLDLEDDY